MFIMLYWLLGNSYSKEKGKNKDNERKQSQRIKNRSSEDPPLQEKSNSVFLWYVTHCVVFIAWHE
jgi:hypothetical protein